VKLKVNPTFNVVKQIQLQKKKFQNKQLQQEANTTSKEKLYNFPMQKMTSRMCFLQIIPLHSNPNIPLQGV
jgi:hypothetical protein